MKQRVILFFIVFLFVTINLTAAEKELRGTWVAWAGTNVPSTDEITATMEALAAANFNIVYVDVWRYGYPYFRSNVFKKLTRISTDPGVENYLQPKRDVLAEMIVEAHRVGLEVEAWFESGFNGALTKASPLYQRKPEWFAKRQDGSLAEYGQAGLSLIHTHPEVQQFLIDFAQETIERYDIDGVDMDRIRYPELDCGYDDYTVNLYQSEHDGASPPTNEADSDWIQWRADKLTEFMGEMFDSLKAVNSEINITNAPLPWGPEQFCQDWAPWINRGYLDVVIPQMYYTTNSSFIWRLNRELDFVDNDKLVYPGISTTANGKYTPATELVKQIETIREKGLEGHVIWYHNNLIHHQNNYLDALGENVYQSPAEVPYRDDTWMRNVIIIDEMSKNVMKTDGWKSYSGSIPLYDNQCFYTNTGNADTLTYFADIEQAGYYEIYVFINTQNNANANTRFQLQDESYFVDQTIYGNAGRWEKLSDIYLETGANQEIISVSASEGDGNFTFADAVMLIETRRPVEFIETAIETEHMSKLTTSDFTLNQNHPNPFNSNTTIAFNINKPGNYELIIYDLQGNIVSQISDKYYAVGHYKSVLHFDYLASGIYFYGLKSKNSILIQKMTLLK